MCSWLIVHRKKGRETNKDRKWRVKHDTEGYNLENQSWNDMKSNCFFEPTVQNPKTIYLLSYSKWQTKASKTEKLDSSSWQSRAVNVSPDWSRWLNVMMMISLKSRRVENKLIDCHEKSQVKNEVQPRWNNKKAGCNYIFIDSVTTVDGCIINMMFFTPGFVKQDLIVHILMVSHKVFGPV